MSDNVNASVETLRKPSESLEETLTALRAYGGEDAKPAILALEGLLCRKDAIDLECEINKKIDSAFLFSLYKFPDPPKFDNFIQMFSYTSEVLAYLINVVKTAGCDKYDLEYLRALAADRGLSFDAHPFCTNIELYYHGKLDGAIPSNSPDEVVVDLAFRELPGRRVTTNGHAELTKDRLENLTRRVEELNEIIQDNSIDDAESLAQIDLQSKIEHLHQLLVNHRATGSIDPSIMISGSFTYEDQLVFESQILKSRIPERTRLQNAYSELEAVLMEIEVLTDELKKYGGKYLCSEDDIVPSD